jgi:hypothetical protein
MHPSSAKRRIKPSGARSAKEFGLHCHGAPRDAVLVFVREWFALLEPFSRNATPTMWEGTTRMYTDIS